MKLRLYELVIVLAQNTPFSEVEKVSEDIKNMVTESRGEVIKHEYWLGANQSPLGLAYSINNKISRNKRGFYIFFVLNLDSVVLKEIQRKKIALNESVIRWLFLKIDKVNPGPTMMMKRQKQHVLSSGSTQENAVAKEMLSEAINVDEANIGEENIADSKIELSE